MARGLYVSPTQFVAFAEPRKTLTQHIATRDRSPDFQALGLYLPNPDPILKKMGRDISIYRELRSDAHTGGCIRRRKAAVKALEWKIERDRANARMQRLVNDVFSRLDMDTLQSEILEAVLYGWQPLEVMWAPQPGRAALPFDVIGKPPEWFLFDAEARLRFRSRENLLHGERVSERKFLLARQEASYANPYGFPDLSMCFWPVTFKRGGLRYWVKFAEKYGMPWAVGKQPRNTPQPETDRLLDQLEAMIEDAVAVIPDDASVEMLQAAGASGNADAYERLLMFCRSEVAIALLGQNQSTESDSTHASATAGIEVASSLRDGDKRMVESVCNELIRWIVDVHEGETAPAPRFEMWEEEEVSKAQAERDEILSRAGIVFTPAYWKRTYDLQEGDIESAPVPPAPGQAQANPPPDGQKAGVTPVTRDTFEAPGFAEQHARSGDPIDALVDEALSEWKPVMAPWMRTLQQALDDAKARGDTAEQLLERLPELVAQLDSGMLAEQLAKLGYAARLAGQAGLGDD